MVTLLFFGGVCLSGLDKQKTGHYGPVMLSLFGLSNFSAGDSCSPAIVERNYPSSLVALRL